MRWSTSELADEIYELLFDDSEAANSLSSPVSTAPKIEQHLSRIPFRCKENIPVAFNVLILLYAEAPFFHTSPITVPRYTPDMSPL